MNKNCLWCLLEKTQIIFGSLQEVTISDFFSETNLESSFQDQDGIKKKPKEKGLEAIVTARGSWLVLETKITYSDFLKKPKSFIHVYILTCFYYFILLPIKIRWWKLNKTSCQKAFGQEVTRILGGKDG